MTEIQSEGAKNENHDIEKEHDAATLIQEIYHDHGPYCCKNYLNHREAWILESLIQPCTEQYEKDKVSRYDKGKDPEHRQENPYEQHVIIAV